MPAQSEHAISLRASAATKIMDALCQGLAFAEGEWERRGNADEEYELSARQVIDTLREAINLIGRANGDGIAIFAPLLRAGEEERINSAVGQAILDGRLR